MENLVKSSRTVAVCSSFCTPISSNSAGGAASLAVFRGSDIYEKSVQYVWNV